MEKIEEVQALLSGKYPRGVGFEKVFEVLIDKFLERQVRRSLVRAAAVSGVYW